MTKKKQKKLEELREKFDPLAVEVFSEAITGKARAVFIYQTEKSVEVWLKPAKGRKKALHKFPLRTHRGLVKRILIMAGLPERKPSNRKAGMIQVGLEESGRSRFIAFYVEDRGSRSKYKREIVLAPIWISLYDTP